MKAEELRIGNLVYWDVPEKQNVPHGVVGIFQNRLQTQPISLGNSMEEYLPIHLSPEWLERFGFENINELSDGTLVYRGKPYLYFKQGSATFPFKTAEVKYVHQLQNLYFALTGKELELKQ